MVRLVQKELVALINQEGQVLALVPLVQKDLLDQEVQTYLEDQVLVQCQTDQ